MGILATDAEVHAPLPEGYIKLTFLRLTARGVESRDGVTLGGAAVSTDGTWVPAESTAIASKKGMVIVAIPKGSAILLRPASGA